MIEEGASGVWPEVLYLRGGGLLSQEREGQISYFHADGLNGTRLLTGESGLVNDSYAFEAYGKLDTHNGDSKNDFLFAGEQYDSVLQMYYLRARWISDSLGGFASLDTYLGAICDPATLHKYAYARQDPVNRIDPSGNMDLMSMNMATSQTGQLRRSEAGQRVHTAYNNLKKLCDSVNDMTGNVRHHVIPWFTRGIKGKKDFIPDELLLMLESVHNKLHPLLDSVLRLSGLPGKSKGVGSYSALRGTADMLAVLDALIFAGELFDSACDKARGQYSMKEDMESMKHLLGL
ncbi:RHS repeat domain-containing protein [Solimonas sp. K1W22B-7]|uniref:RHS repeat domain-containing protein n=1 Tax=Solimonas sp. K1W22B-7 TaxID=2303331 RepID=UPI0013C4B93E|nr:RHS repeat-associated core domain-containing protein [Solimonas sp. K1W22B-7]